MKAFDFGRVVALMAVVLGPDAARAADPVEGRDMAERWCAACHTIAPGEASDKPAPSFETIVNQRGRSGEWIGTWLSTPHEMMPDLTLSREEIAALVAYFDSLWAAE